MNRLSIALAAAGLALLVALLVARPAGAQDLLVGQVAALTNPGTTANAKGLQAGLQVYFKYVNERGGVGGRQVKLITKDDELAPGKMLAITKEYIANKNILALAGYVNTGGITEVSKSDIAGPKVMFQ